jgi:hypothetical protein
MLRRPAGPFLIPARFMLVLSGLVVLALGTYNLGHELRAAEVDVVYVVVAGAVAMVFLISLGLGWRGAGLAAVIAGIIAFVEFGVIASTHFVSGPAALSGYIKKEGLPLAAVLMGLLPACTLCFMAAIVSWSHPRGHRRRYDTLPVLLVAVVGTVLVILATTDSLQRSDFGTGNPEDAAFAATVTATAWLVGAFWIARVRRTGAIVIVLATFNIWYSFVTLHLAKGGTPVSVIATKSGPGWAVIAVASAAVALAAFLAALGILALAVVRPRRSKSPAPISAAQRARP